MSTPKNPPSSEKTLPNNPPSKTWQKKFLEVGSYEIRQDLSVMIRTVGEITRDERANEREKVCDELRKKIQDLFMEDGMIILEKVENLITQIKYKGL